MKKLILMLILVSTLEVSANAAWLWDNSNDEVHITDAAALTFPDNEWAVSFWVKRTNTTDNSLARRVVEWTAGSDTFDIFIRDHTGTNPDDMDVSLEDAGLHTMSPSPVAPDAFLNNTAWTQVVIQRTGTASTCTVTIYINGVSAGSATDNTLGFIDAGASFYLGNASAGNRPLNGSLAEFAKWDRALSAGEIVTLQHFAPTCIPRTSLKFYVPMIRNYVEMTVPLTVTNGASTAATTVTDHPRIIYCGGS